MASDVTSAVVSAALRGGTDADIESQVSAVDDGGKKKFDICNCTRLTCCERFDRANLGIAILYGALAVGGVVCLWAGLTPLVGIVMAVGTISLYPTISGIVYNIKKMELGSMAHQTNRLRKEVDDLQEEVGKLETTNKELTTQVDKLTGQLAEFDDLINKFSTSFQIHDAALSDRVKDITKASGKLDDVLAKIRPVFNQAAAAQNESSAQLKELKGSVSLLSRGVKDYAGIRKEQKKLILQQQKILEREVEMQKQEVVILKRFEVESRKQQDLTTKLQVMTDKFDNEAKPAALKLMSRVFFYAKKYNELRDSFNDMRGAAKEEVDGFIEQNPTVDVRAIRGMFANMQRKWEVIQGDHALSIPDSLRERMSTSALREVRMS